jgi:hypothetical protein
MQQLVDLLGGRCEASRPEPAAWPELLALAGRHRVLPWVASQLLRAGGAETSAMQPELLAAQRAAKIDSFLLSAELAGLLKAFAKAGLPVIALKGPSFAQRVYGDASLRSSRDLDLLVLRQHFAAAQTLLQAEGFLPSSRADDYHQPWQRRTTGVELHFDVENPLAYDFNIDAAFARACPGAFEGSLTLTLAPADEMLYLCLHAVRHRFDCLGLVLDLCLAFESRALQARLGEAPVPPDRASDLWPAFQLGCRLALRLRPSSPARKFIEPSPHLDRIASARWNELISEDAAPVLDWRAQHRFYLSLEQGFRSKCLRGLRHLRILATRAIQPDYDFASRFGIDRPWLVLALRPVRLLTVSNRSSPAARQP